MPWFILPALFNSSKANSMVSISSSFLSLLMYCLFTFGSDSCRFISTIIPQIQSLAVILARTYSSIIQQLTTLERVIGFTIKSKLSNLCFYKEVQGSFNDLRDVLSSKLTMWSFRVK